VIVNTDTHRQA